MYNPIDIEMSGYGYGSFVGNRFLPREENIIDDKTFKRPDLQREKPKLTVNTKFKSEMGPQSPTTPNSILKIVSNSSIPTKLLSPKLPDFGDEEKNDDEENFLQDLDHVEPSDDDSDTEDSQQGLFIIKTLAKEPVSKSIPPEARMAKRTSPVVEIKKTSPIVEVKKVSPVPEPKVEVKKPPLVPEVKVVKETKKKTPAKREPKKKKGSPAPEVEAPPKKKRVEITPQEAEKVGKELKHQADTLVKTEEKQKGVRLYILSSFRYLYASLKKERSHDVKTWLRATIDLVHHAIGLSKSYPEEHALAYLLHGFASMKLVMLIKNELKASGSTCHNSVSETKKWVGDTKFLFNVFDSLEKSSMYQDSPFHTNFYDCSLDSFVDYFEEKYNKLSAL